MNSTQKRLLTLIQAQFPIEIRPFLSLAEQVGTSEQETINHIRQLKEEGIIRRIGAFFNADRLGYTSSLIACQVPREKIEPFIQQVNTLPGVSHNYGRDHKYNIWFTLSMPTMQDIDCTISRLRKEYDLPAIYSLPTIKMFKLRVRFSVSDDQPADNVFGKGSHQGNALDGGNRNPSENSPAPAQPVKSTEQKPCFTEGQLALIRQLQEDIPLSAIPFTEIAAAIGQPVENVISQTLTWKETGIIRRFGGAIRHQRVGFNVNGMVVFQVEPAEIEQAGTLLAKFTQVSHCYQRPTVPGWPYNLFAMTHCQNEKQLQNIVQKMVEQINPIQHKVLRTTREYKKETTRFFI